MGVADLLAAEALDLAGRFVLAQRTSRLYDRKLPTSGKRLMLVDLVEHDQAQDRPDAGDGAQEAEGDRIVHLGAS